MPGEGCRMCSRLFFFFGWGRQRLGVGDTFGRVLSTPPLSPLAAYSSTTTTATTATTTTTTTTS
jgi:hypothetical protein